MYVGQALVHSTCGNGTFCHTAGVTGVDRYGVPAGLNFDLLPAETAAQTTTLRKGLRAAYEYRHAIMDEVRHGDMPPSGRGALVSSDGDRYREEPASLSTSKGQEILRNWLACGSPIVERTDSNRPSGVAAIGDILSPRPVTVTTEPTWTRIYEDVLVPRCGTGPCHSEASHRAELTFANPARAYDALINQPAAGDDCKDGGADLVVPGDPERSLLVQKLTGLDETGQPVCGEIMPLRRRVLALPESLIDPIREWVEAGALEN